MFSIGAGDEKIRQDDEEENSGSGKLKNFYGISGYDRFFHGKSGSNTPPGGPLVYYADFGDQGGNVWKNINSSLQLHLLDQEQE